jgi:AcrR family transcriptional regulator
MAGTVKRTYRSTLRTTRAADTRRAIVEAATRLFTEQGYAATTTDAIAATAGVSRKTVFTAVGGKADLLKTALDWAVAGDDQPIALADRPEIGALLALTDPARLLSGWIALQVQIDTRVWGLFRALAVAAETDPSARELLATMQDQRHAGAAVIVDRVAELGALSTALSRADAVDVAWLSSDPVLFDRMVRVRGWSVTRFESWLATTLTDQLLTRAGVLGRVGPVRTRVK